MKKVLFTIVALALAIGLAVPMAIPVGANGNLIVNGGFEAGNTGFTTEYTYLDPSLTGGWTLGPEYMYTVSTNPNLYHSAWTSFLAHGGNNMMIVNGTWDELSPGYNAVVWAQTVTPLTCVPTYPETTITLYAGQTWDIGDVLVKTSATGICVKFVLTDEDAITEGWLITEAHVAAAATFAGIPQKNGNPIPGKFPVNVSIDPGVTETEWYCLDYAWVEGTPLYIAAHAKIEHAATLEQPYDSETGWGEGTGFPGKNWATYITYTPEVVCDYGSYLLEFWAGNSYPGSEAWPAQPAILEVLINSTVVGTLTLEYNPPYAPTPGWMKFSTTWDAGSETSAIIEIRDTRHIMYGDDFVLDDISFVKQ